MIRPLPALLVFALAYAGVIAALVFLRSDFITILFGFYVALIPWFYYFLKVSFPEGLPREGIAALLAYSGWAVCTLAIYNSPLSADVLPYLIVWGAAVAVFNPVGLFPKTTRKTWEPLPKHALH